MRYVIALDQGTTSSRAIMFDENGTAVASHGVEFEQLYPQPGWVEHRPEDILSSQVEALKKTVEKAAVPLEDIAAIGITNQRETTLLWDKATGEPLYNAIVWQCRRTAPLVERLKKDGLGNVIRERTGLIPDAYFSGTKLQWLLDHLPDARACAQRGELCFGTVDSFLAYKLTKERVHITDETNAARTMLYNIHTHRWDELLLKSMSIPPALLPKVVNSSQVVGVLDKRILGIEIPVAALIGDQHAALFGQGCTSPGMVKNTYGTGCFMLMHTGSQPISSENDLLTTVAWRLDGKTSYALEGSVFMTGAAVQWLRDEMQLIATAAESEQLATSLDSSDNVYMVPAFTGLGAPHWDMYSRGTIIGLTRGTGKAHVVRATLESIAYQTWDVLEAMMLDSGLRPGEMRVDGGASANSFLMQFQADILRTPVVRPQSTETTARGAAMLAGRAVGLWDDERLASLKTRSTRFEPSMDPVQTDQLIRGWHRAVDRAKGWIEA